MSHHASYLHGPTGQFTQEDPIGLAGGMNLYGFAGGDPVNFSDPFGLCPPLEPCPVRAGTFMGAALNGIGDAVSKWWDAHKDAVIQSVGLLLSHGAGLSTEEVLSPSSLQGKSPAEVGEMIPKGWVKSTTRGEGGTRYANPAKPGEQVRVMPGNSADPDPVKQGPYCRVSCNGNKSDPIPLQGNPTLPKPN